MGTGDFITIALNGEGSIVSLQTGIILLTTTNALCRALPRVATNDTSAKGNQAVGGTNIHDKSLLSLRTPPSTTTINFPFPTVLHP